MYIEHYIHHCPGHANETGQKVTRSRRDTHLPYAVEDSSAVAKHRIVLVFEKWRNFSSFPEEKMVVV